MKRTTVAEIKELLTSLGVVSGSDVMIHSSLFSLGLIQDGIEGFHLALSEIIGETGTIVVPTFTHSFRRGEIYDINSSPSDRNLGVYPEFIRKRKGAVRSSDPLFSMSAIGPKAEILMERKSINCFGTDSVYDKLFKENILFLALGITYSTGLSAFMHIEKMATVPYRKNLLLQGISINRSGEQFDDSAVHFCRDEENYYNIGQTNRERMGHLLEVANISKAVDFCNGRHFSLHAKPFLDFVLRRLKDDPFAMFEKNK
jgi:aminoglycoside 3-N-acetyltransferase